MKNENLVPLPVSERHRLKSLCVIVLLFANSLWLLAVQLNSFTQRHGAPPTGWSWSAMILLDLISLYALIRIASNYYRDTHTVITGESITQSTLLGTRVLRWADVTKFTIIGYTMHLPRPSGKVVINTAAYGDAEALIARITDYIDSTSGDEIEDDNDDEYLLPPPDTEVI